jgi:hypothetical protein
VESVNFNNDESASLVPCGFTFLRKSYGALALDHHGPKLMKARLVPCCRKTRWRLKPNNFSELLMCGDVVMAERQVVSPFFQFCVYTFLDLALRRDVSAGAPLSIFRMRQRRRHEVSNPGAARKWSTRALAARTGYEDTLARLYPCWRSERSMSRVTSI